MKQLSTTIFNGVLSVASGGTSANTASKSLVALGAQPALITNSNIASINGTPLLGSGNISIFDLQVTTIYTSNYTAVANDLIRCDTISNSFTITLPLSPVDGDIIGFVDVTGYFGLRPVVVSSNGKTIENDTSLILNIPYVKFSIIYNAVNTNWKVLGTGGTTTDIRIGEPSPPTAVSAAVSSLTITITGTPPTVPSEIPITLYTVTSSPLGLSGSGASFPITLTATTAQAIASTAFTFTVTATNAAGTSVPSSATNSVTPTLPPATSVGYLIVAGGGAGGGSYATSGGGGGGGFLLNSTAVSADTPYTVTVGAGGITTYNNGANSSFGITGSIITATGGGYGGQNTNPGGNGGSGGGGSGTSGGTAGGTGTSGQGFAGGVGQAGGGGGGGGGAGGSAANVNYGSYAGSAGGTGLTGFGIDCSGGGGGGTAHSASTPGSSSYGGGAGGKPGVNSGQGLAGTVNTGGGGGGGGFGGSGGAGGSGIVIVRYANTFRTATTTGSPTITDDGTYKIYKFTGSGTISF